MKKKKLLKLLEAIQPFTVIAPFYDMKETKLEDSETISVGHWTKSPVSLFGTDFNAVCAFKLSDFRKLSQAFVEFQRDVKSKSKPKSKVKSKKRKANDKAK